MVVKRAVTRCDRYGFGDRLRWGLENKADISLSSRIVRCGLSGYFFIPCLMKVTR